MSESKWKAFIDVAEARNLAVKDSSGFSDPYVVIKNGIQKQTTQSISRSLNPEWHEVFVLIHMLSDIAGPQDNLILEVWDKDYLSSDDFMGTVLIPLKEAATNAPIDKWYVLQRRPGKENEFVSGEINLGLHVKQVDSEKDSVEYQLQMVNRNVETELHNIEFIDQYQENTGTTTISSEKSKNLQKDRELSVKRKQRLESQKTELMKRLTALK